MHGSTTWQSSSSQPGTHPGSVHMEVGIHAAARSNEGSSGSLKSGRSVPSKSVLGDSLRHQSRRPGRKEAQKQAGRQRNRMVMHCKTDASASSSADAGPERQLWCEASQLGWDLVHRTLSPIRRISADAIVQAACTQIGRKPRLDEGGTTGVPWSRAAALSRRALRRHHSRSS